MSQERIWVGWYYAEEGRQVGPVPRSKIVQLVADGQLQRRAKVWRGYNEGDEFRLRPARAEEAIAGGDVPPPEMSPARLVAMLVGREGTLN